MVVGLALVFESKTSVGDVIQVLEPLEERNGDTTSVDVQVGDHKDVAIDQDLIGGRSRGTIGRLSNDLINIKCLQYKRTAHFTEFIRF